MEQIVFFIYTIIKSDNRHTATSKVPVYATIFLISFFELFFFLPLILFLNKILSIVNFNTYLSLPLGLRYLVVFGSISLLFFMNFYLFGRENKIEGMTKKLSHKKDKYIKYKWLLLLFAALLGFAVLVSLNLIRDINVS